jgi:hypothetical protein
MSIISAQYSYRSIVGGVFFMLFGIVPTYTATYKVTGVVRTTADKTLRSPTLTFRRCSVYAVFIAKT